MNPQIFVYRIEFFSKKFFSLHSKNENINFCFRLTEKSVDSKTGTIEIPARNIAIMAADNDFGLPDPESKMSLVEWNRLNKKAKAKRELSEEEKALKKAKKSYAEKVSRLKKHELYKAKDRARKAAAKGEAEKTRALRARECDPDQLLEVHYLGKKRHGYIYLLEDEFNFMTVNDILRVQECRDYHLTGISGALHWKRFADAQRRMFLHDAGADIIELDKCFDFEDLFGFTSDYMFMYLLLFLYQYTEIYHAEMYHSSVVFHIDESDIYFFVQGHNSRNFHERHHVFPDNLIRSFIDDFMGSYFKSLSFMPDLEDTGLVPFMMKENIRKFRYAVEKRRNYGLLFYWVRYLLTQIPKLDGIGADMYIREVSNNHIGGDLTSVKYSFDLNSVKSFDGNSINIPCSKENLMYMISPRIKSANKQ